MNRLVAPPKDRSNGSVCMNCEWMRASIYAPYCGVLGTPLMVLRACPLKPLELRTRNDPNER